MDKVLLTFPQGVKRAMRSYMSVGVFLKTIYIECMYPNVTVALEKGALWKKNLPVCK